MQIMSWLPRIAYLLAAVSAISILLSGPLYKWGLWSFGGIFQTLKITVPLGLIAMLVLLISRLSGAAGNRALLVMLVLGVLLYLPISSAMKARELPFIHDISTDTDNPPAFTAAIRSARADAQNPPEYPGSDVAAQQASAYPDIQPLTLAIPPADVMQRVKVAVNKSGWDIVSETAMTLEATDTTFWFGFKDDIIIRLQPQGSGTRVDIRSKSRVGRSDIGKNAARIRQFSELLTGG